MNNINLNITDYNFNEILNIFKIKSKNENYKFKIDEKLQLIKNVAPENVYTFFVKCKLIILIIFDLFENNIIKEDKQISKYLHQLQNINNLEKYNEIDLINKLINDNKIIKNEKNILDIEEHRILNIPDDNLHAGRINPNLNNKNNTNIIYNSFTNEVAPGNLNSVKRITQLLNLNLNSSFRNNYYQSNPCDFLYMIPAEIKNVVSMRLVSIEIPNAWYLFSSIRENNTFVIIISLDGEKEEYTICVPDGNYDSETLQHYLNTTYFYQSGQENLLKFIKFGIHPYSSKSYFEIVNIDDESDADIYFSLKFSKNINQNFMNTMGWLLGFRLATYLNCIDKIESESLFDAGGDRYIYLCINDFQYNKNTSNIVCFDKSILNEDVIAKIPMINGKLSLIINDNNSSLAKLRRYNGPVNLSRLQIKIIDKFGTIIDLNNMDYSLTLELEILYESFNFKNVTS